MKTKRYEYLVSYMHVRGYGRIQVFGPKKIDSLEEVEKTEAMIREKTPGIEGVAIMNIVLLREWSE